ncbi:hypothetical protein Bca4012_058468 [Brassica carinata]
MIKAMMMMNRQATPRRTLRGHNSRRAIDTSEAMSAVIMNACYRQDHTITSYLNELIRHRHLLMEWIETIK